MFAVPSVAFAPLAPSAEEIVEAKRLFLDEVLRDFPFDGPFSDGGTKRGDAERAHTVALLLQPFVRQMISGPTPIFLIDKPTPGSGAGLLVDAISIIATGRPATPGGAILVRPDGFIGFRAAPANETTMDALDTHLATYLVPGFHQAV